MREVITIAVKHNLYGRFALNLAISLRAIAPDIEMTVITDDVGLSHLDDMQMTAFTNIVQAKPEHYIQDGRKYPLRLKYHVNEYATAKEALFVDADTIFSPMANLHQVFDELKGCGFTIANRGKCDPSQGVSEWVESGRVNSPYWYDVSSEFMYFEKCKLSDNVFKFAREAYDMNQIPVKMFAGDKPDEPFIMAGMVKAGVHPHQSPYLPSYWYHQEGKYRNVMDIKRNFILFSLGGKLIPTPQKRIYDEFCKNVAYMTGYRTMGVSHKERELPERKAI